MLKYAVYLMLTLAFLCFIYAVIVIPVIAILNMVGIVFQAQTVFPWMHLLYHFLVSLGIFIVLTIPVRRANRKDNN